MGAMEGVAHGLAGAGGSVAAITIVYPMEKISKQMQSEGQGAGGFAATVDRIYKEGGIAGFYQGIGSSLIAMVCSMYSYFATHDTVKRFLLDATGLKELTAALDLLAGYTAGVSTAVLTEPIWMINTRLALQKRGPKKDDDAEYYEGVIDCAQKVWKKDGLPGFFKGLPGALGTVMNSAIQIGCYEQLRKLLLRRSGEAMGATTAFALGAVSKMIATLLTYPLTTVGTRMQNQKGNKDDKSKPKYTGTVDCATKMLASEGISSFYHGLRPRLFQMVVQNAFKFMFYERIVGVLLVLLLGPRAPAS